MGPQNRLILNNIVLYSRLTDKRALSLLIYRIPVPVVVIGIISNTRPVNPLVLFSCPDFPAPC